EFRWYVEGGHRRTERLARVGKHGEIIPDREGSEQAVALLKDYLARTPESISKPRELARRMARLAHIIRDVVVAAFEKKQASLLLTGLRRAFATVLIPVLEQPEKTAEFADMYAQTIAYGLFAARCNHRGPGPFRRLDAAREIPKTNPFLRKLFETITGTDLDDEPYAGFVDDLAQLLAEMDMVGVFEDFRDRRIPEDPVVHFYETFLASYDPALRETRGVYYTPEPVVSYIVRSVDELLKTDFGVAEGLADQAMVEYVKEVENDDRTKKVKATAPRVLILDPACGTGTFLYAVVDHIREQFMTRNDAGMWSGYVRNHLLPRLFGFELLMAPYAVAHFKLAMQLSGADLESDTLNVRWAYDFTGDERLGIYLTNTLEQAERKAQELLGPFSVITEEANAAARIKRDLPILVVTGNPPYSGHSANRSWRIKDGKRVRSFIGELVQDYYQVDGQPLGERNPKWLQDDYVKFIRWGQWRIERTGAGILGLITNHAYLDNPTFRGMRQQLMNAFDEIYVLDLHGGSRKKEVAPDGSKDENIFDIQQGV
ncbi:N-6 DNA methylase, partial [Candidatus Sumerlaeota bacterium]|nr:N-6 DNA methylase [Candidatus Sumerlaeota bacterium]